MEPPRVVVGQVSVERATQLPFVVKTTPRVSSALSEWKNDSMCALSPSPRTLALWTKLSRARCAQNGAPMYSEPRSRWKITARARRAAAARVRTRHRDGRRAAV
jgi:hypothetical protein